MSSPVRYVVRRAEYTPPNKSGVRRVLPEKWSTAATFAKSADAHAEYAKLLAQARRTLNPFQLGGPNLFYQTSLPAYALHDYLLDHGLTPPPTATTSNPNYVFWWVKNNRTFTDDQRAVVWQACDKLKPFEVVEEDDRQAAWLVVEGAWPANGLDEEERPEGGDCRAAFPTRRQANRELREYWSLPPEADEVTEDTPNDPPDGFNAEVITVPLAIGLPGQSVILLCRRSLWASGTYCRDRFGNDFGFRVPLVAHSSHTIATALSEQIQRGRRTVNPFTLLGWANEFGRELLDDGEALNAELPNGLTMEDAFATLRRLDTTPPPPESNELLADWYDQVVQWSPEFIDVIWGTFADFRLFEVIEVPFG